ncbi:recombinase family protein [Enterococcus faecium]|uniref:recombinase family protein n=1 Tax=Enterococcus faecium TaxID=1352 RepID=UPI003981A954
MRNKTIGYIRTSKNTQDLGLEVQRKALEKFEPDELFSEQISGRKEHRTELDKALKRLEKGDTLIIYNLARLSRSSRQLVNLISELNEKEIYLKSIQESIDTRTASGRLFFTVLAGIAKLNHLFNQVKPSVDSILYMYLILMKQQYFNDGNKRLAYLLTNQLLMNSNLGVLYLPSDNGKKWYEYLKNWYEKGEYQPFISYLKKYLIKKV